MACGCWRSHSGRASSWPSLLGRWRAPFPWHNAALAAITISQVKASSHARFTALLQVVLDFLKCSYPFTLEGTSTGDSVNRGGRESRLDFEPVAYDFLQQFTLCACQDRKSTRLNSS